MEILSLARYSNDTVRLAEERDGYVPEDIDDNEGMKILMIK